MADFDPAWPHGHQTRDGRKARVICTDAKGRWPIIALTMDGDGNELPLWCGSDGRCEPYASRLINAPPPKWKVWARRAKGGVNGQNVVGWLYGISEYAAADDLATGPVIGPIEVNA